MRGERRGRRSERGRGGRTVSGSTERPMSGPVMRERQVVSDDRSAGPPARDPSPGPPWVAPTGVSVVVVADHPARWAGLAAGVAALANQTRRPDEVIVVVDGSDELLGRASVELGTVAEVVASRAPGGEAALETGAARAGGDVVAFLEDAIPRVDWVEQLLAAYGPDVAGVAGRARPMWDVPPPAWYPLGRRPTGGVAHGADGAGPDIGDPDLPPAVMSVRRSVLAAVGGPVGLASSAADGGGPAALAARVRAVWPSARLVVEPSVVVEHGVRVERRWLRTFVARCWTDGRTPPGPAGDRSGVGAELTAALRLGLRDTVGGRWSGLGRAGAALVGLVIRAAGSPARRRAGRPAPSGDPAVAAPVIDADRAPTGPERPRIDV